MTNNKTMIAKNIFYNCHRFKSSLLSLKLSFSIEVIILADDFILHYKSKLWGSIIKITQPRDVKLH